MYISYTACICFRYSLSKEDADDYVLCDVIGCIGSQCWRTECVRVVGDNEKPLLLQSLWKPKEGFARRFEIQRKATVEENNSKDQDTVTAGIPRYDSSCIITFALKMFFTVTTETDHFDRFTFSILL